MLYMIVERFKNRDAAPVYRRYREQGRLANENTEYVASWVDEDLATCFQVMKAKSRQDIDDWISHWDDLVDFEVIPVLTSDEALQKISPLL